MRTPLVSVLIPTYQRGHTLTRAIESSLDQDYRPIQIVVSDNASTDETQQVLERFSGRSEILIHRQPSNIGAVGNWRTALGLAEGDLIKINWSDDWMDPTCVSDLVSAHETSADVGFAISNPTIHLPERTVRSTYAPGRIGVGEVIGSRAIGLGLPVSPGAALIERIDAEWALGDATERLPPDCVSRAIGPDLLMLYGALRRGKIGAHTGRTGPHFEGGSDSITMSEDGQRLSECYMAALLVLLDEIGEPANHAALQYLLLARTLRRGRQFSHPPQMPSAAKLGASTAKARAKGLAIAADQLRQRLLLMRRGTSITISPGSGRAPHPNR